MARTLAWQGPLARVLLERPGTMRIGVATRGWTRMAARRLAAAGRNLAASVAGLLGQLAYRRQEAILTAMLAASLVGGVAVERWRQHDPAMAARIEAEPPRLAPAPRPAPRSVAPTRWPPCRDGRRTPAGRIPAEHPTAPPPLTPETPLDVNRATAADLTRLPGIGRRLAERILQQRAVLGGQFRSADDLATVPGLGPRKAAQLGALVTVSGPLVPGEPATGADDAAPAEAPP